MADAISFAEPMASRLLDVPDYQSAAAPFHERHDFVVTPSDPRRLGRKLSTVAKWLELPWP